MPLDVRVARNHLMSRFVLDLLGVVPFTMLMSRNNYERLEHGLASLNFWTIGILLPLLLEYGVNRNVSHYLIKRHGLRKDARPLAIPFEFLEHHRYRHLRRNRHLPQELLKYGIPSIKAFSPQLRSSLLLGKNVFIAIDLMLLGMKGIMFYYLRNALTEKLSGKKGFVGIFNDARKDYREKLNKNYDKSKQERLKYTALTGMLAALALPILLYQALKSPAKAGKGLLGQVKKHIGFFNYSNAIYMSKWVILYSNIFHYNLPKIAFSRDKHEMREVIAKTTAFDLLFFMGDDIFGGLAAKAYQRKYRKQLKGFTLYQNKTFLGLNIPVAKHLDKVYEGVNGKTKHLGFKLARKAYLTGIGLTVLSLGIVLPLINVMYTRQKVLKEQGLLT